MIANALLFTILILLAYGFWLLDQLKFMAPYKAILYHAYGTTILIFLAVLFLNLFGAALTVGRRFFLKNTGRKLSHLDKQFNVSHADLPAPVNEEDFNLCRAMPFPTIRKTPATCATPPRAAPSGSTGQFHPIQKAPGIRCPKPLAAAIAPRVANSISAPTNAVILRAPITSATAPIFCVIPKCTL